MVEEAIVRRGKCKDSVMVRDIWLEFMKYHQDNFPFLGLNMVENAPDIWEEYFKNNVRSIKKLALVAEVNGIPVGYLLGGIIKQPPVMKIIEIGTITDFAVTKKWRNRGIGSKLLKEFERWCKSRKIKIITLQVADNNKNSINFYKKHNFQTTMLHQKKQL